MSLPSGYTAPPRLHPSLAASQEYPPHPFWSFPLQHQNAFYNSSSPCLTSSACVEEAAEVVSSGPAAAAVVLLLTAASAVTACGRVPVRPAATASVEDRWTASAVVGLSSAVVAVVGGFAVAAGLAEVVAAVVAAEVGGGRNMASEAGRAVESLNRGSEVITQFLGS